MSSSSEIKYRSTKKPPIASSKNPPWYTRAPELNEKTITPARARQKAQTRNTMSKIPSRLPNIPSGDMNHEASMRTTTVRIMIRITKKWRPPMRIVWPRGIRNAVNRKGQIICFRGSKKIRAMAMSIATRTMGCRTVSEAPPPNLRFSGGILVTLHLKWGRQSSLGPNRSESQLDGLAVNSAGDEFFEESSATFPCKLSDALVGSTRQTDSQVVVA